MKAMCISKIALIIFGFTVLTSYSGQWEVFTGKNDVRDIARSGNTLWAATTGGVVAWNLEDNSYRSYTTLDGIISCNINQVAIDKKGRPWVATKNPVGLFVYENHVWEKINLGGTDNEIGDKIILGLEVDRFGNVWVYTRSIKWNWYPDSDGTYLWRYDGRTWHKHEGVYGPLALDHQKNLLAVDSLVLDDNYSVSMLQFRIVSFNGSEFISKSRSKVYAEFSDIILVHIAKDSKGNPWISYFSDDKSVQTYGVFCNNIIYNTLDGLGDDNVRSITVDESGTVWCATDGGISKFTGVSWINYDTTKGVASNLTYKILFGSNNTLYAATSKGISILKSNTWKTLKTINEPSHNNYTDMVIDNRDAVILSGRDHIATYNDLQWKMNYFPTIRVGDSYYSHFPSRNNNKSFIKAKDGTVYAIGNEIEKGGCILKQGTNGSTFFEAFSVTLEKRNRFLSPAVACSGNDSWFWITAADGNLISLNKNTVAIYPPSKFCVEEIFPDITCMLLDQDGRSVWVGYEASYYKVGGIVHFDGDTVKKLINKNNGLASERINAIARDSSENLWFAWKGKHVDHGGGVSVLSGTKLTTYLEDSDGRVFGGGCNALFVDKSGIVWTYSDHGIVRYDGSSWKLFNSEVVSPDLPYARYSHIIQDKSGTVWFGTEGSGLLSYKDNRWRQFTQRDGLPDNSIRSCALDSKNNLWILTDNGIAMRKFDGMVNNRARYDFGDPGITLEIKQSGNRLYVSSNNKPEMIRYTLFDLRGRVILKQTIRNRKFFVIPESNFNFRFGSGLRILLITLENADKSQNKYFLKMGDIK